jgi:hypothetical protein
MAAVASRKAGPSETVPRGGLAWYLRRPSSTGTSGLILGGLILGYAVGPIGGILGMIAGVAVGEALERYVPSEPEKEQSPR